MPLTVDPPARREMTAGGFPAPMSEVHPSSIAWVSATAAPIELGRGDLDQSMLMPLVNQFGAMQQQMLDQFQQAVSMLVQMFGNLHRDQMNTIREELDQLKDLTAEVQAIKLELAARSGGVSPAPGPPARPSEMRRAVGVAASSLEEAIGDRAEESLNPIAARIGPAVTASSPDLSTAPRATPPMPDAPPSAIGLPPATDFVPPKVGAAMPDAGGSQDVILWLHQRMTTLQQERETRWQKILRLLPGAS
jgi:hypothetical protein